MSKRVRVKVTLAIAALGAMTLLQGCGDEDDVVFGFAWGAVGSIPIPWLSSGITPGTTITIGTSGPITGPVGTAGTP